LFAAAGGGTVDLFGDAQHRFLRHTTSLLEQFSMFLPFFRK